MAAGELSISRGWQAGRRAGFCLASDTTRSLRRARGSVPCFCRCQPPVARPRP